MVETAKTASSGGKSKRIWAENQKGLSPKTEAF